MTSAKADHILTTKVIKVGMPVTLATLLPLLQEVAKDSFPHDPLMDIEFREETEDDKQVLVLSFDYVTGGVY